MTDKEILEEVYRRLKENVQDRAIYRRGDITSFIEQEWQRQDEPQSKWRQANHPRADSSDPHRGFDKKR